MAVSPDYRKTMPRRRKRTLTISPWHGWAMFAMESQHVIALRMLKMSRGGPPALAEANLMLLEKWAAGVEAGTRLMTGDSSHRILDGYRKKVRANARRLSKD